jgi:hypothetical protein
MQWLEAHAPADADAAAAASGELIAPLPEVRLCAGLMLRDGRWVQVTDGVKASQSCSQAAVRNSAWSTNLHWECALWKWRACWERALERPVHR